jgi:hypothetical protein
MTRFCPDCPMYERCETAGVCGYEYSESLAAASPSIEPLRLRKDGDDRFSIRVLRHLLRVVRSEVLAMSIPERIQELVEQHGSLRAAALVLKCDVGYLSRLLSGAKVNPGLLMLRRLGLRKVVTYERSHP